MKKQKLKGKDIAVYFGTFAPLHKGHRDVVTQAKRGHDGVVLIVSGKDTDRASTSKERLFIKKRYIELKRTYADDDLVYVAMLDENNMPSYPHGWDVWTNELIKIAKESVALEQEGFLLDPNDRVRYTYYVGEKEYETELNKRLTELDRVKLMDRSIIKISGTAIRENPVKYWDYISRHYRKHYSKNILVLGGASSGKSTLVKDLARLFESPFSPEFSVNYQSYDKGVGVEDDALDSWDWVNILTGQFNQTRNEINSTSNNGMVFADTNSTQTDVFAELDVECGRLSEDDYYTVIQPLVNQLAKQEKWDIIFVIPPIAPYVDDNRRNMEQADENIRWDFHDRLLEKIKLNGWENELVILDAPITETDKYGHLGRYEQAKKEIVTKFKLND